MGSIIVFTNLTLDGVIQGPGRPDEDTRGGFTHGGWAAPYGAMQDAGDALPGMDALLFGRRTYEDFYDFWPKQSGNPFSARLDALPKHVASTTLAEPLPWVNSTLLRGDTADAVAQLKADQDGAIVIMGSGVLVQSLMRAGLIDRYVLLVHPLVLGSGRRIFPDGGAPANLKLVSATSTSKDVAVLAYEPGDSDQVKG
jgi:dihydrofolate reductase